MEYHTVDKKKAKASNCIYLTEDRICKNKKSEYYLSKCFVASYCPLKKSKSPEKKKNYVKYAKEEKVTKYNCTLPLNTIVHSSFFGDGKYIEYDSKNMHIVVDFNGKIMKFQYPDAFTKKYLSLSNKAFKYLLDDLENAKKG